MKKLNNSMPIILFALLSLVIILPLLSSGFILTLDRIPVPKIIWPAITSNSFLFDLFRGLVSYILSVERVEKIILFLIFFLSGWGMYRLFPEKWGKVRYFGGLLFTVNPFVYERVMAGHWNLLLGYSLLPFIFSAMKEFFDLPGRKTALKLGILGTALFSIVIHLMPVFFLFFIVYGAVYIVFHQNRLVPAVKFGVLLGVFILLFNINWIVPVFLGKSDLNTAVNTFGREDLIAFQSVPDENFGLIFNLVSGYGFWGEANKYFVSPKDIIFFWPLLSVVILALSIGGLVKLIKEKDRENFPVIIALTVIFLVALDFAGGVALRSFANTIYEMYVSFPVLRGLREPQKLIGVIMFCLAYFGSAGVYYLLEKVKVNYKYPVIILFLALPFIYTLPMFNGFWGQLKPAIYPPSWTKVNQILNKDKDNFLVLSLPWHQYMPFKFSHNVLIANPIPSFFDKPILSSRNYETKYLYTHEDRPEALHVEGLLAIEKKGINLLGEKVSEKSAWGESLAPIGVKYVILVKDDDWKDYGFIMNSSDLEKAYDDNEMTLYKNLKWSVDSGADTQADPQFLPVDEMAPIDN